MQKRRIAIFASGGGSNARAIINYFSENEDVEITLILSNNADAGVLDLAEEHQIETMLIDRFELNNSGAIITKLQLLKIDLIVLAGFLLLIPEKLIEAFPKRIINIHPALLPKYGGKGMYGHHVHEAVKKAEETISGITIHFVDENYDEGQHIFQKICKIDSTDSPGQIAAKVLRLEHRYFALVIDELLNDLD